MTPDIKVAIDNPKPVYSCGDRIKGTIQIQSESPICVNDLIVQLLCEVATRTKGPNYTGTSRLNECESVSIPYCFVKRIITRQRYLSSASECLRFDFTLPEETKRNDVEPSWRESPIFENVAGHALPPTWTTDYHMQARVDHYLEVSMHAGERYEGRRVAKRVDINFISIRAVEHPDPKCQKIVKTVKSKVPKAFVSQAEPMPRKRSIIEMLTPEEKPSMPFQVEVLCPTVLYAGGPVPVSVSTYAGHQQQQQLQQQQQQQQQQSQPQQQPNGEDMKPGNQTPNQYTPPDSPKMPPVDSNNSKTPITFVEGLYAFLDSQTDRRVREKRAGGATKEHTLSTSRQVPLCSIADRPVAVSPNPGQLTPLHAHYPELRLRPQLTPSFRGFSLRRKYTLRLRLRLVIGDQEHAVDFNTPVLVLPSTFSSTAGAVMDTGELMPGLRRRGSEETLPPYEEVDPSISRLRSMGLDDPPPALW